MIRNSAKVAAGRIREVLDTEPSVAEPAAPVTALPGRGELEVKNVTFRYDGAEEPVLHGVDLVARPGETTANADPGQMIAIVGPTGAGKTTLVNLLMRFYDLDAGRITVDGVDVSQVGRERLRGRIGMVQQDTWLFGGTIAENIAYGKPDATRVEVVAAAQAAHADHFIRTLPDGYDTVVDTDEGSLSAGERQLITLARAFLIDPSILILDEATSSVDTRTEMLVQQAMVALRRGRTSFVIAHRLSTLRDADVIVVMEHGQVVEQGGHKELLEANGAYARLYAAQFAQPAVGEAEEATAER